MTPEEGKRRLERAAKLVETIRELQAKTYEATEELQKILAGDVAIGDLLKRAEKAYETAWSARYHSPYQWGYGNGPETRGRAIARSHLKRLIKGIGIDDLEGRMAAFLKDGDSYYVKARHPFGLFVTCVNRFVSDHASPGELTLDAPTVADCRHTPPCATDQEHTRKRVEEMRQTH